MKVPSYKILKTQKHLDMEKLEIEINKTKKKQKRKLTLKN